MTSRRVGGTRWRQIALSTLAVTTCARVALALSGVLEGSFIADDAYYYFTIARHIAHGQGPTFDGLAPTNGFHPLWQLALVPLFAAFHGLWAPVRAALLLAIGLDLVTAWRIHRIVRARGTPDRAWMATAIWSASPFGFLLGLRGMEASLNTLSVVLLLEALTSPRQPAAAGRRMLQIGVLLGACGLARTDNLVTVGVAVAVVVLEGYAGRTPKERLAELAVVAAVAAAVVAPWFLWSWSRFGQLIQVSGQVKLASDRIFGALPGGLASPPQAVSTVAHMLFAPVLVSVHRLSGQEFGGGPSWAGMAAALLLGGGTLLVLGGGSAAARRGVGRPALLFVTAYVLVHALLFGLVWRAYADWYAGPTYALLAVVLVLLMDGMVGGTAARRRVAAAACALTCAGLAAVWISHALRFPYDGRRPEQRFGPLFARILAARPQGARLGAWDAGMGGYVATSYPGLTVVNLDGLVNNQAFEAVRRGDYLGYLERTVDVYLQDPGRARMYLDPGQVELLRRRVNGPPP